MKKEKAGAPTIDASRSSPFVQFSNLCRTTDQLLQPEERNQENLRALIQKIDMQVVGQSDSQEFNGYLLIIKLRILNILRVVEPQNKTWQEQATSLVAQIRSAGYWVERLLEDKSTTHNITISQYHNITISQYSLPCHFTCQAQKKLSA